MGRAEINCLCDAFDETCRQAVSDCNSEKCLQRVDDQLWSLTGQICRSIDSCSNEELSGLFETHFEPNVLKWCRTNSFISNLWTKPSGYAGDYRTIEMICQNHRSWTAFEDIFLNHLLRSTMAKQHRAKVADQAAFVANILETRQKPKLLDAGCGPCFDVRLALQRIRLPREAELVFVDLDPSAISFAESQLKESISGVKTRFLVGHVLSVIKELSANVYEVGTYDAILFGGLFDYLPDRMIIHLLRMAMRLLRPDGQILFSQVSPDNPDRTFMKWYGDWELRQRDEQALRGLCSGAGVELSRVKFRRERCGIAILAQIGNCLTEKDHLSSSMNPVESYGRTIGDAGSGSA
jgi:SAM-dependent methyltransferase